MKNFNIELNKITEEITANFVEPFNNNELSDFINGSSKKIRSTLALLFIKSFDKDLSSELIKVFAATEIIHNASLLHDDVIDDADTRRGEITISKAFSPKISILAGDYILAFALEKLISINNNEILEIYRKCIEDMCKSEIEQYFMRHKKPTQEQYLSLCKNKTALLFMSLLESCAILLNLDRNLARKLGETFGIIFQINNDLEHSSAIQDKKNGINTANNILGVEKTQILLDNYYEEIRLLLKRFPNNIYKDSLEDLVNYYVK